LTAPVLRQRERTIAETWCWDRKEGNVPKRGKKKNRKEERGDRPASKGGTGWPGGGCFRQVYKGRGEKNAGGEELVQ